LLGETLLTFLCHHTINDSSIRAYSDAVRSCLLACTKETGLPLPAHVTGSLFHAAGFDVTPFPVDFRGPTRITLRSFIPSGTTLAQTDLALHEICGRLYYALRGLVVGPAS
jgi:hypothetical protein